MVGVIIKKMGNQQTRHKDSATRAKTQEAQEKVKDRTKANVAALCTKIINQRH